jgi:hypothetical protein
MNGVYGHSPFHFLHTADNAPSSPCVHHSTSQFATRSCLTKSNFHLYSDRRLGTGPATVAVKISFAYAQRDTSPQHTPLVQLRPIANLNTSVILHRDYQHFH